jgi:hypothetical protein
VAYTTWGREIYNHYGATAYWEEGEYEEERTFRGGASFSAGRTTEN